MFFIYKGSWLYPCGRGVLHLLYSPPPSPLLAKNNIQCKCFKRLKKKFASYLEEKKHKVVDLNCLHLRKYLYCQVVLKKKQLILILTIF